MFARAVSCCAPRLRRMHSSITTAMSRGGELVPRDDSSGVGQASLGSGCSTRKHTVSPTNVADDGVRGLVARRDQVRSELGDFAEVRGERLDLDELELVVPAE